MGLDFESMLNSDMSDGIAPPPLPSGDYRAVILERKFGESKAGNRTCQFTFKPIEATATVDASALDEFGAEAMAETRLQQTYTFTEKAVWRLDDFLGNILDIKSKNRGKAIEDAIGQEVLINVTHTPTDDGKGAWANIKSIAKA